MPEQAHMLGHKFLHALLPPTPQGWAICTKHAWAGAAESRWDIGPCTCYGSRRHRAGLYVPAGGWGSGAMLGHRSLHTLRPLTPQGRAICPQVGEAIRPEARPFVPKLGRPSVPNMLGHKSLHARLQA